MDKIDQEMLDKIKIGETKWVTKPVEANPVLLRGIEKDRTVNLVTQVSKLLLMLLAIAIIPILILCLKTK